MAIEWTKKEDWNQSQDNTGVVHDSISDNSGHGSLQQGYKTGSLTEGLVAYYPMEKGRGNIAWDAAHDKHGTINGATWNGSGKFGSDSLSFDGSNDYIPIPGYKSPLDLQGELRTDFTICLWFRTNDGEAGISGVQGGNDPDNADGHDRHIYLTSGNIGMRLYNSGGSNAEPISSGTNYADGNWHHVIFRVNSSDGVYGFIDGSQFGYDSNTSISDFTGSDGSWSNLYLMIGHSQDGSNQYFTGEIDDVRIYSRPLSYPEIQTLYNLTSPSGFKQTEDVRNGLKHEYKLDGDATDSVGSVDGSTSGGINFVEGYRNQAGQFNGTDSRIDTSSVTIDPMLFSWSAWVKTSNNSQDQAFISLESNLNYMAFYDEDSDGNRELIFYMRDQDNNTDSITSESLSPDGNWHHILGVRKGSGADNMSLYIDGKKAKTSIRTNQTADNYSNISGLGIGYRASTSNWWFDGLIDEARVYSRVLKPYEIEKIYRLGRRRIDKKEVLH